MQVCDEIRQRPLLKIIVAANGDDDEMRPQFKHIALDPPQQLRRVVAADARIDEGDMLANVHSHGTGQPTGPTMPALTVPRNFGIAGTKGNDPEGPLAEFAMPFPH